MASVLPTTGTEISMGRIAQALGINPNATSQTALSGDLGAKRNLSLSSVPAIPSGTTVQESSDFGGLSGSGVY